MKGGEEVIIEGKLYRYDEFYNRLEFMRKNDKELWEWDQEKGVPSIRCPKCYSGQFMIKMTKSYGSTELHCECGEILTMD